MNPGLLVSLHREKSPRAPAPGLNHQLIAGHRHNLLKLHLSGSMPWVGAMSRLLLAVEVSWPNDPAYDYQTKRALYMANGIPEYWALNGEAMRLSRCRGAADPGEGLSARLEWQPASDATFTRALVLTEHSRASEAAIMGA
jgi:hypothetical protein